MQQNQPAFLKMKTWQKVGIGLLILAVIGTFLPKDKTSASASTVETTKDSVTIRKEFIDKAFSQWDGSQFNLVKLVKDNMNDPESFKHVETKYWDMKDKLVVLMNYRGKNAYGGVVTESVKVETDLQGNIIKVLN